MGDNNFLIYNACQINIYLIGNHETILLPSPVAVSMLCKTSITVQFFTIIIISLVFGVMGALYSFFGLFQQTNQFIILEPFRLITAQELGGHLLFGALVAIPSRNIKIILLTALMAVTIDSDHLLNIVGFHVQGRLDHSILFAILSSILMGLVGSKIYHKISGGYTITVLSHSVADKSKRYEKANRTEKNHHTAASSSANNNNNTSKNNIQFSFLFLIMTMATFLAHIAYYTFVDNIAAFPLLAPFSFAQIVIPRIYSLPIEASGFILIYLYYAIYTHRYSIFVPNKKNSINSRYEK